jgi:subtilisin family serine protease
MIQIAFKDFVNGREQPYDDHGQGTHVAGTICQGSRDWGLA